MHMRYYRRVHPDVVSSHVGKALHLADGRSRSSRTHHTRSICYRETSKLLRLVAHGWWQLCAVVQPQSVFCTVRARRLFLRQSGGVYQPRVLYFQHSESHGQDGEGRCSFEKGVWGTVGRIRAEDTLSFDTTTVLDTGRLQGDVAFDTMRIDHHHDLAAGST